MARTTTSSTCENACCTPRFRSTPTASRSDHAEPEDASRAHSRMARHFVGVDLLGRYSNPDNVARLHRILSGQGRDRPSHRPVPSLKQKPTRLVDSDRTAVLERYLAGETANALAEAFDVNRATVFASCNGLASSPATGS